MHDPLFTLPTADELAREWEARRATGSDDVAVEIASLVYDGGPLAIGQGITSSGVAVLFVMEPRYALRMVAEAADATSPLVAVVPTWAVIPWDALGVES